jgi:uncharacterized protein
MEVEMIQEPQKRISEQALKVWRISGTIKIVFGWVLTAVLILFVHIFNWPIWIPIIFVVLGVIFTYLNIFLFPILRFRRFRYEVRDEEIELQEGFIIRRNTLIPIVRVQHVDTIQGPLLRKYHLASVIVHTAATAHEIPALEESEAEELRLFISKLARVADEDV